LPRQYSSKRSGLNSRPSHEDPGQFAATLNVRAFGWGRQAGQRAVRGAGQMPRCKGNSRVTFGARHALSPGTVPLQMITRLGLTGTRSYMWCSERREVDIPRHRQRRLCQMLTSLIISLPTLSGTEGGLKFENDFTSDLRNMDYLKRALLARRGWQYDVACDRAGSLGYTVYYSTLMTAIRSTVRVANHQTGQTCKRGAPN
jgi:hypothetical protein